MGIFLKNCVLVDIDPPRVRHGALRIVGQQIADCGDDMAPDMDDEIVDCNGGVVMPGMVNGHTHLYSALATGMPPPVSPPRNFLEILQSVWWRLDRALDAESIEVSARVGALDALRCGTTTLIDHHASPNCIAGSLDLVESGLKSVGVRGVLCYETTDRNGAAGRLEGIEENRRYLAQCASRGGNSFAGIVGAHASFTLEDGTLDALAELAEGFHTGVHIHVAEDPCDEQDCIVRHKIGLMERLSQHGIVRNGSIFAHCTHLQPEVIATFHEAAPTVAHNPSSNMNNAVGYTPVGSIGCPIMLGTDGIGADMFAEARSAWLISRHARARLSPGDIVAMMAASARRASTALGITLGKLTAGAAADVVITDYRASTPLDTKNLMSHMLFALGARHVRDVILGGRWVLRQRKVQSIDEQAVRRKAEQTACTLWKRMASLS